MHQSSSGERINRNIVECKDHTGSEQPPGETVLIETLWNVKGDWAERPWAGTGINRNIVECKEH